MVQISIGSNGCFTEPRKRNRCKVAVALAVAMTLYQASTESFAASPGIIAPNPEQQGIPSIRREETVPKEAPEKARPETEPAQADQVLPSAIRRVDLQSPLLSTQIEVLLRQFIGKQRVSGKELEQARGQIWDLCRQHGRLTRVELRAIPGSEAAGGSILQARIYEISVRAVRVEQEGDSKLKQALLDDILASAKADIAEGGVLNLDRLDSRIKRRMFLKDVDVRVTLVPVDPDHVDVKVLVSARPVAPLGLLAQYDNNGMRTYGRSRYTAGVSIPGRLLPGDQLDVMGIKSSGMTYVRLGYEFPLVGIGARMNAWGSHVGYRAPSGENGNTSLLGAGLIYPLHIGNAAVWMGYLNYFNRHEVDRLANDAVTADKRTDSVQGKVDANYFLGPAQSLRFNAALTLGELDLSSLPSALAQDRISAKTDGGFTKLEWEGGWSTLFGRGRRLDTRLGVKGQFASKNLDQSEKFALGGPTGVRAYAPVEAMGDEGYVATAEIGYRPIDGLHAFAFYDIGHTRRYRQPWVVESIPLKYTLQGAGVGLAYSYKSLVGSITYARQIGDNPGLSASGLDSDGLSGRYRTWFSLTLGL